VAIPTAEGRVVVLAAGKPLCDWPAAAALRLVRRKGAKVFGGQPIAVRMPVFAVAEVFAGTEVYGGAEVSGGDAAAPAVWQGRPVAGQDPFADVVEVEAVGGACTGIAIDGLHVLTAAHCGAVRRVVRGDEQRTVRERRPAPGGADAALLLLEAPLTVSARTRSRDADDEPIDGRVHMSATAPTTPPAFAGSAPCARATRRCSAGAARPGAPRGRVACPGASS
jgi:hypothetical protein